MSNTGGTVQPVTRPEGIANTSTEQDWRPTGRMRGSLSGKAYSEALNQYIIQPTQPVQLTRPTNTVTSPSGIPSPHFSRENNMNMNPTQEANVSSAQPASTAGKSDVGHNQTLGKHPVL